MARQSMLLDAHRSNIYRKRKQRTGEKYHFRRVERELFALPDCGRRYGSFCSEPYSSYRKQRDTQQLHTQTGINLYTTKRKGQYLIIVAFLA